MRASPMDWKSLTIGLLVGACAMLAYHGPRRAPAQPAAPATVSPRYQIAAYPGGPGETIIWALDHQTNKVWQYKGNWERGFTREEALTLAEPPQQRR